jgi:aryl carrier-like protein
LNVSDVGPDDNFLELGGDSIAATLCLNRLRDSVDHNIPVSALLEADMTLKQFVTLVAGSSTARRKS